MSFSSSLHLILLMFYPPLFFGSPAKTKPPKKPFDNVPAACDLCLDLTRIAADFWVLSMFYIPSGVSSHSVSRRLSSPDARGAF